MREFALKQLHLIMSSAKCQPFCIGLYHRKQKSTDLTTLWSLMTLWFIITTTYSASSDDAVITLTLFCFQWPYRGALYTPKTNKLSSWQLCRHWWYRKVQCHQWRQSCQIKDFFSSGYLIKAISGSKWSVIDSDNEPIRHKKIDFRMSSAKWRLFCFGSNVLCQWQKAKEIKPTKRGIIWSRGPMNILDNRLTLTVPNLLKIIYTVKSLI